MAVPLYMKKSNVEDEKNTSGYTVDEKFFRNERIIQKLLHK